MKEIVLQERRTLDDVLISSVCTFPNGCNYRLVRELDDNYYLEYGCYGVHINLATGDDWLLHKWFSESGEPLKKLSGVVSQDTIRFLLTMIPCSRCGGARFRIKPE